jgi:hypothetical protein
VGGVVVAALAVQGFGLVLDTANFAHSNAAAERRAAALSRSTPVVESRVLGSQDFKEMLKSEHFWRSLRTDANRGRGRDDGMRWSPRPDARSESGDWGDDALDGEDELTTYRTVCVRLCDGYYWPISFATSPEQFARDAAVCERSCSSSARLFVYRNPGQQPEQMVDLAGRRYARLDTAFNYRTTYDAGCQCRPEAWAQESLDRHRMYALQAERRKGNQAAARELASLKAKLATAKELAAAPAQRRAETRSGEEPVMRLGGQPPPRTRDRRSQSSSAGDDDWMRRVLK